MSNTLYWVKFIEQERGQTIDDYFMAKSLAELEENIADILEIKIISNVHSFDNEEQTK